MARSAPKPCADCPILTKYARCSKCRTARARLLNPDGYKIRKNRNRKTYRDRKAQKLKNNPKLTVEQWVTKIWHSLRQNARKRGLAHTVTRAEVESLWTAQDGKCALSRVPMDTTIGSATAASIDRKDSSLGYVAGNVQLICWWLNMGKSNYQDAEIIQLLHKTSLALGYKAI